MDQFPCQYCDKTFAKKFKLKNHLIDTHELQKDKIFMCHHSKCKDGDKVFEDEKVFKEHFTTNHSNKAKSVQCEICGKNFCDKYKLKHHKAKAHENGAKMLQCDKCKKEFLFKTRLESHQKTCGVTVSAPKDKSCDQCDKSFANDANLQRHKTVVHKGEKKFKCETCAIYFKSNNQLNNHNKITHRPLANVPVPVEFKCEECDVVFAFHETYEMHCEMFHSHSSRGYFCPICKELYKEKDDLVEHVVAMHGIQCQKCVHCEKSFNFTSELKNHIKKVHTCSNCLGAHDSLNENHQCGFCSEGQKVEKMENSNIEIDPQELVHQNAENDHKDKESNEANLAQPANSKSSELQKPVKGKSCEKYPAKNSKPSDDVIQQQKADSNDKTNKPKKTRRMKRSMIGNSNEKVSKIAKLDTANADHVNDDK